MKQKGFTLIEVLVGMLVGGMIMSAVIGSVYQITTGTGKVNWESTTLADMENAAHCIVRDVMMAHSTDLEPGEPPMDGLHISWQDLTNAALLEESVAHSITYTHSGKELQRNYDGVVTIIGRDLDDVSFGINGRVVSVNMTSTREGYEGATITRKYLIYLRSQLFE